MKHTGDCKTARPPTRPADYFAIWTIDLDGAPELPEPLPSCSSPPRLQLLLFLYQSADDAAIIPARALP